MDLLRNLDLKIDIGSYLDGKLCCGLDVKNILGAEAAQCLIFAFRKVSIICCLGFARTYHLVILSLSTLDVKGHYCS